MGLGRIVFQQPAMDVPLVLLLGMVETFFREGDSLVGKKQFQHHLRIFIVIKVSNIFEANFPDKTS
jgi:hypothetical protein